MNKTLQARNICLAHGLSLAQGLYAVTHNLFQSPTPSHQGGAGDFSLLQEPPEISVDLSNAGSSPAHVTWQAYAATAPAVFGKTSAHYCCQQWREGCA
jgi:hypothetical protein